MEREYSETCVPPATRANTMTSMLSDGSRPPENGGSHMTAAKRWKSSIKRHLLQQRYSKTLTRIPSALSHRENGILEASSIHIRSMPALEQPVMEDNGTGPVSSASRGAAGTQSPVHPLAVAWSDNKNKNSVRSSSSESAKQSKAINEHTTEMMLRKSSAELDDIDSEVLDVNDNNNEINMKENEVLDDYSPIQEQRLESSSMISKSQGGKASQEGHEMERGSPTSWDCNQSCGQSSTVQEQVSNSDHSQSEDDDQQLDRSHANSVLNDASHISDNEFKDNVKGTKCMNNREQMDELKTANNAEARQATETGNKTECEENSSSLFDSDNISITSEMNKQSSGHDDTVPDISEK